MVDMNSPGVGGTGEMAPFMSKVSTSDWIVRSRSVSLGTGVILGLFCIGVDSSSRWYPVTVSSIQGSEVMSCHCESLPPRDPVERDPEGGDISFLSCLRAYTGRCPLRWRVCPPL